MRKTSFIVLLVSCLMISCKYGGTEEKVTQIQELEARLHHVDSLLCLLNPDSMKYYYQDAMRKSPAIDSMKNLAERESKAYIEYMNNMRFMNRMQSIHADYQSTLDSCKGQLSRLKQDVQNGLLSKRKFSKYIAIERSAVQALENKKKKTFYGAVSAVEGYQSNRIIIDSLYEQIVTGKHKTKN